MRIVGHGLLRSCAAVLTHLQAQRLTGAEQRPEPLPVPVPQQLQVVQLPVGHAQRGEDTGPVRRGGRRRGCAARRGAAGGALLAVAFARLVCLL